jgi:hypothetical protein
LGLPTLIIIRIRRGQIQKFCLQLLQPLVDIRQILVTFAAYDGSDVVPQSNKERIFIAECLIDGFDCNLLNLAFRHRAGVAEKTGVF